MNVDGTERSAEAQAKYVQRQRALAAQATAGAIANELRNPVFALASAVACAASAR